MSNHNHKLFLNHIRNEQFNDPNEALYGFGRVNPAREDEVYPERDTRKPMAYIVPHKTQKGKYAYSQLAFGQGGNETIGLKLRLPKDGKFNQIVTDPNHLAKIMAHMA